MITGKTPDEIRPRLQNFESRRYVSPSMMAMILNGLNITFTRTFMERANVQRDQLSTPRFPDFGLVRIQWDGRWCDPGVPIPARYRRTHWIAFATEHPMWCFDVNAMALGGWITLDKWRECLVPWLIKEVVKGGNGRWWVTDCWQVTES